MNNLCIVTSYINLNKYGKLLCDFVKINNNTTMTAIKIRERFAINLMFGPPRNPNDVNKMQAMFFAKQT